MVVKDLVLNSLETIDKTHIDHGKFTKALTKEMYLEVADYEVKNFYLDIKDNMPVLVIVLEN